MDVAEVTDRLTRRFGAGVAGWCARAPALAEQAAVEWGLVLGEPFGGGASSVTLHCMWPDGTPGVLKLSPDSSLLAEQVAMLRGFAPCGRVPAVLGADPRAGAAVFEAIRPGTGADELPEPPSPQDWADLLRALHCHDLPIRSTRDLRDRCEEFFARIGRRLAEPVIAEQLGRDGWDRAMRRCDRLLRTNTTRVTLHGDLHLGNVLDGGPDRGLVAIDPKVCVGDPCFDAVDYVLAAAGQNGAIDSRCELIADAYGLNADRLHAWCRVIAPLVAIALLTAGDAEPAVAELLDLAQ